MISRASSRRRTGSPNSFVVTSVPLPDFPRRKPGTEGGLSAPKVRSSGAIPHGVGRVVDGLLDVRVARAPAEVAADHVVDLLLGQLGRVVALVEARGDRDEEARCAEPALQRVALAEGLLDRMQHLSALAVLAR